MLVALVINIRYAPDLHSVLDLQDPNLGLHLLGQVHDETSQIDTRGSGTRRNRGRGQNMAFLRT